MTRFQVSLDELVADARVPVDEQVESQAEVVAVAGEIYSPEAEGMGMPRLPGAGL